MSKHSIEGYISSIQLFSKFLSIKKKTILTMDGDILREYVCILIENNISYKKIKNRFLLYITFYDYLVYEKLYKKYIFLLLI